MKGFSKHSAGHVAEEIPSQRRRVLEKDEIRCLLGEIGDDLTLAGDRESEMSLSGNGWQVISRDRLGAGERGGVVVETSAMAVRRLGCLVRCVTYVSQPGQHKNVQNVAMEFVPGARLSDVTRSDVAY